MHNDKERVSQKLLVAYSAQIDISTTNYHDWWIYPIIEGDNISPSIFPNN